MTPRDPEILPVAVRAFLVVDHRDADRPARRPTATRRRRRPKEFVVFDAETTTDRTQRFAFGVFRRYVDDPGREALVMCVQEGIVVADDLGQRDPEGLGVIREYVRSHKADVFPGRGDRLLILSRSEFVEEVLWRRGYKARATIVGFNLPFDLSRLALHVGAARGRYYPGFSLRLWEYEGAEHRFRPRIAYKTIDSRRHLTGFTDCEGTEEMFRGHFLDLRSLTFALSERGHTLESACKAFGVPFTKRAVSHGTISSDYIDYCREDVAATSLLARAALEEFGRHPIDLQPTKAFSGASVGKAYLAALGVRPVLDRQPDFAPEIVGWATAAFFGGRTECRIRNVALPVVTVDFTSMYPTVNALMGSWGLLTAERIDVVDATDDVRALLAVPNLAEHFLTEPWQWRQLVSLVEVEPDGDILPVRAAYDPKSSEFGIGVNPYWLDGTAWYALSDVVAASILTGRPANIRRAVRLRGRDRQDGLRPVKFRDNVFVDPAEADLFRTVIEERHRIRRDETLSADERERLSGALKVLANSTSYGIFAECRREERPTRLDCVVYADGEPHDLAVANPDEPGPWSFPPVAACISAAARLMLALLEHEVMRRGGSYVMCDTDSMAIVSTRGGGLHACPGGPDHLADGSEAVRALSYDEVDAIVARFASLSPYSRDAVPGSILRVEEHNFDARGRRRQLHCLAISAKRYALFEMRGGRPTIVRDKSGEAKASKHGLGHLLNPTDPDATDREWITEAWLWIIGRHLDLDPPEPGWFGRMATAQTTIATPAMLGWFAALNADRDYADQIKPANFLLVAFADPMTGTDAMPVAPYETRADRWETLDWVDRRTDEPVRITSDPFNGDAREGVERVRTYRDVVAAYAAHPEPKSLGPDGAPVRRGTRGLLRRRPLCGALPIHHIGKEANLIEERQLGLVDGVAYQGRYDDERAEWRDLWLPALRTVPSAAVAERAAINRRSAERILRGAYPRRHTEAAIKALIVEHAHGHLGTARPADDLAAVYQYLRAFEHPSCDGCGGPLGGRQRRWCSERCRKGAHIKGKER